MLNLSDEAFQQKTYGVGTCAEGKPIDVAGSRLAGLQKTLDAAAPSERAAILTNAGVDAATQSALTGAFTTIKAKEQTVDALKTKNADIERQLAADYFRNCTNPGNPCTQELRALEVQKKEVANQLQISQTELDTLKNNTQRMLAGEPPSGYIPSADDRIPSSLDFARAGQSTFTTKGNGTVASEEQGGIFSGIMDYAYYAGAAALKLPGTVAETAARWTPRVIEGGRAGAEAVRTIVTGLPEGVKVVGGNVTTVAPKVASKVGTALLGPAAGATVAITGAVELGVGVGNAAGEYFFGPIDEESRSSDVLARLDELSRVNIALPGSESPRTVQELGQQIGLTPKTASEPVRASGGLLGFGSQPIAPVLPEPQRGAGTLLGFGSQPVSPVVQERQRGTGGLLGFGSQPIAQVQPEVQRGTSGLLGFGSQPVSQVQPDVQRGVGTLLGFGSQPVAAIQPEPQRGTGGLLGFGSQPISLIQKEPARSGGLLLGFGSQPISVVTSEPQRGTDGLLGFGSQPISIVGTEPARAGGGLLGFGSQPISIIQPEVQRGVGNLLGFGSQPISAIQPEPQRGINNLLGFGSQPVSAVLTEPQRASNELLGFSTQPVSSVQSEPQRGTGALLGFGSQPIISVLPEPQRGVGNLLGFGSQPVSPVVQEPQRGTGGLLGFGVQPISQLTPEPQRGTGELLGFGAGSQTGARPSLVPQIKGPILTVPDTETEEQSDSGGTGGGNPPNPPGGNKPPDPPNTGIGWKWPIIGTGVGAGTCWLWWCNSTETTPSPVETPAPRSTNEDNKTATEQPDTSSPAETGTQRPDTPPPPEQPQYAPRIPDTGITYPEDHYCVTNVQPLTVYIIPKGTPFPTNCYNNPYQTTPYPNYPPPGYVEAPARPSAPNNIGQSLGQALQRFITGDDRNEREETPVAAPRPISATSTPTTTPQLVPALLLVANPTSVAAGQHAKLSWASVFTRACSIADADGAQLVEFGESSGSVVTPALSVTTTFTAVCTTNATSTTSATTTVKVR